MSTTPDQASPKSSAFGRYFFVLLLGLVLGAVGVVMLMRAWDARRDHFPDSVMQVQAWHLGQLDENVKVNRCAATDILPHLQALRTMANDLEPAFTDLRDDKRYVEHATAMRGILDDALGAPPIHCESAGALVGKIKDACGACHKDFGD